jgi:hypothetical protein
MTPNPDESPKDAAERAAGRKQLILAWALGMGGVMVCAVLAALAAILNGLPPAARIAMILWGIAALIANVLVAANLNRKTGSFECPHCRHRFTPTLGVYLKAIHGLTSRRLVCPVCGARGRCVHRLTKSGKP